MRFRSTIVISLALSGLCFTQDAKKVPPHPTHKGTGPAEAVNAVSPQQFAVRSKFALNVLHAAVALPQNDDQDRLRVLVSAAQLANAISPKEKTALVREGMQIEARLIASGEKPQVSMVESGFVDCASVAELVNAIRPEQMTVADHTISAAVTQCPRQALPVVERELADALTRSGAPPRSLMATMRAAGAKSNWTRQEFDAVFSNLPDPSQSSSAQQAPLYALLYQEFAPAVDASSASHAGAKLLVWLGKMHDGPERVQAAGTAVGAIKKLLGKSGFQQIVESDPIANQAANLAGKPVEMPTPVEEPTVRVGQLDTSSDHTADLEDYPAPRRAREGAAYGFAAANAGNKELAQRYFEIAFSALNDIWADRLPGLNLAGLVDEVSQAAATVDPVEALREAQRLQQSSAQAISMLAVAQTVLTRQAATQAPNIAQR